MSIRKRTNRTTGKVTGWQVEADRRSRRPAPAATFATKREAVDGEARMRAAMGERRALGVHAPRAASAETLATWLETWQEREAHLWARSTRVSRRSRSIVGWSRYRPGRAAPTSAWRADRLARAHAGHRRDAGHRGQRDAGILGGAVGGGACRQAAAQPAGAGAAAPPASSRACGAVGRSGRGASAPAADDPIDRCCGACSTPRVYARPRSTRCAGRTSTA